MLKIATKNQNLIRIVYSSTWLSRFFVFNLTGIDLVKDPVLRNEIISHVTTEERHGKTTAPGRFKDIDEVASKYVRREGLNIVHDVGVSSGITSCDFHDAVFSNLDVEYCISDKYTRYYYSGRHIVRVFDAEENLLYGYIFALLADRQSGRHYPLTRLLSRLLGNVSPKRAELNEICLFDPRTIEYVNQGKLKSIDYDVFRTRIVDRFTYVRCMNVLNRNSWFTCDQISQALSALCESMVEGGVLQVGRSRVDGTHDVGFFTKKQGHMELLESINKGTELEAAVLSC